MKLLENIKEITQDVEKANLIFQLMCKPSALHKYMQSDKGKASKKKSNAKYQGAIVLDETAVPNHIKNLKEPLQEDQYFTCTELWDHYNKVYKDKPCKLTRKQYKNQIDLLKIPQHNPHVRNGKKYYTFAYQLQK